MARRGRVRRGLAALASAWTVAVGTAFWFFRTGTACTGTPSGSTCHATSVASGLTAPGLAIVIAATVAYGLIPFLFRERRLGLGIWGALGLAGFVATFGAAWVVVPAALEAIAASFL